MRLTTSKCACPAPPLSASWAAGLQDPKQRERADASTSQRRCRACSISFAFPGGVVLKNTGVLRGAAARARRLERGTVLGGVLGGCWCDPAVRPATGPEWCVPIGAVGAMLGGSRSVLGAESVVVSVRRPGQGRTAREAAGGAARGASSHRSGEHGQQAARGVPAKSGSSDSECCRGALGGGGRLGGALSEETPAAVGTRSEDCEGREG